MAIRKTTSTPADDIQPGELTGLESRCLVKRICELHDLVQLTLRGVESVRLRGIEIDDLAGIKRSLEAADLQISYAQRMAVKQLH